MAVAQELHFLSQGRDWGMIDSPSSMWRNVTCSNRKRIPSFVPRRLGVPVDSSCGHMDRCTAMASRTRSVTHTSRLILLLLLLLLLLSEPLAVERQCLITMGQLEGRVGIGRTKPKLMGLGKRFLDWESKPSHPIIETIYKKALAVAHVLSPRKNE